MTVFSRTHVIDIDPEAVPVTVSQRIMQQDFQAATITILLYDIVITMDKEVKYFWSFPKRSVSIVYFLVRYTALLGAVAFWFSNVYYADYNLCNFAEWTRNLTNQIIIVLVDYILVLRVAALYAEEKRMVLFLRMLLVFAASSKIAIFIYATVQQHIIVGRLADNASICGAMNRTPMILGVMNWSIPMVFGFILMVLALYKAADFWKMSAGFRGFKLINVLIRDQAIYFMVAISMCMFNIIEYKIILTNQFAANVVQLLGNPSLLSVAGGHMLIHLKEAGEQGVNEGTSYRMKSLSDMEFT